MNDLADRYAVCERVVRQGSFTDDVVLVRVAGVTAIGVDADAVDAIGADEAARVLDGEGLRVELHEPRQHSRRRRSYRVARRDGSTPRHGGEAPRCLRHWSRPARLGPRTVADADDRCRDWLAETAILAVERDLRIMLEPMHPLMRRWSFVHTLQHALALVEDLDGAGIVVDLGHVWWQRNVDTLIVENIAEVVSVQVTNVDAAALADVRYERAPFEHGDVPVASLVRVLESSGYSGWYENEVIVASRERRLEMLRVSRWFEAL